MVRLTTLLGIIFMSAVVLAQDVHPEVQAALDYQMPNHECDFKVKSSGVVSQSRRKIKKAMKKYTKCTEGYKSGLAAEQKKMMGVAQHGLTQEQANIIMGHLSRIQFILDTKELQVTELPAGPALNPWGSDQRGRYE